MRSSRRIVVIICSLVIVSTVFTSCYKNQEFPPPIIEFISEQGYVYQDTSIALNENFKFGFNMESKSNVTLIQFKETIVKDGEETTHDYTLFSKTETLVNDYIKSTAETETWSFYCLDKSGRKSEVLSVTITLGEGTGYTNIKYIEDIEFGAQDNSEKGNFYSIQKEKMMTLAEAYLDQGRVDFVYYYDTIDEDKNTIASPGAGIAEGIYGGDYTITRWGTKNTARFIQAGHVSAEEFEACRNDSLILANTFDFNSGKSKANLLSPGQIYSFVTNTGLKGMFIVNEVVGKEEGSLKISVKVIEI